MLCPFDVYVCVCVCVCVWFVFWATITDLQCKMDFSSLPFLFQTSISLIKSEYGTPRQQIR